MSVPIKIIVYRSVVILILALSPISTYAQVEDWYSVGRTISVSVLQLLTNPENTPFRVGVTNVSADSGMLVSPQGSTPVVQFIHGNENWLWSAAAEQLEAGERSSFRFEILRHAVHADVCPGLQAAHSSFYHELEKALAETISLSNLPEKPTPEAITVDGTVFPIQIYTESHYLTITADRDVNHDLHESAKNLHRIVSGCSNDAAGSIEEHHHNL